MFGSIIWPTAAKVGYLFASVIALLVFWYAFIQVQRIVRIRRLGGVRAFNVASHPVSSQFFPLVTERVVSPYLIHHQYGGCSVERIMPREKTNS